MDTCSCSASCGETSASGATKRLTIEWRHLDVDDETCDRCFDTGENLAAEVKRLKRALNPQGIEVDYVETKLDEGNITESNTILFNGIPLEDILEIEVSQNYCGSCADLLGTDTYCRTITFDGNEYEDVPAKAIRQAAYKVLGLTAAAPEANNSYCTDEEDSCSGDTQEGTNIEDGQPLKVITVYEAAMCCPTGVCGPSIDPELLRVSAAVEALSKCSGVEVRRFNLSGSPQEFVKNAEVNQRLNDEGVEVLPIVTVDGKIVMTKRYPSNDEFENLLGVTCDCLHDACPVEEDESDDCSCDSGEGPATNSSCCGEASSPNPRITVTINRGGKGACC